MAASALLTLSQSEKYPHFAQLLKDIFEHRMCSSFVTKIKSEEKREIYQLYQKEKCSYDHLKLVYDSIWNIIADTNLDEKVNSSRKIMVEIFANFCVLKVSQEIGNCIYFF